MPDAAQIIDTKRVLRARVIAQRAALTPAQRASASEKICGSLLSLDAFASDPFAAAPVAKIPSKQATKNIMDMFGGGGAKTGDY